jgi:hypothetical protein
MQRSLSSDSRCRPVRHSANLLQPALLCLVVSGLIAGCQSGDVTHVVDGAPPQEMRAALDPALTGSIEPSSGLVLATSDAGSSGSNEASPPSVPLDAAVGAGPGGDTGGASDADAGVAPLTDAGAASTTDAGATPARVIAVEPATVAPEGVAIVTTEFAPLARLEAVRIAGQEVSTRDDLNFLWLDANDETQRFAVRVPSGTAFGSSEVRLRLAGALSQSILLPIIDAGNFVPPSPPTIHVPPTQLGDGVFPIGTQTAFALRLGARGPVEGHWHYNLSFARECADGDPELANSTRGEVRGLEAYFEDAPSDVGVASCTSQTGTILDADGAYVRSVAASVCSEITGEYQVDGEANDILLTIRRDAAHGGPEVYRGGWGMLDRNEAGVANISFGSDVVLRSERTGRELVIEHGVIEGCGNFYAR